MAGVIGANRPVIAMVFSVSRCITGLGVMFSVARRLVGDDGIEYQQVYGRTELLLPIASRFYCNLNCFLDRKSVV